MKRLSLTILFLSLMITGCSEIKDESTPQYQSGYDVGLNKGYDYGYEDGYDAGYKEALEIEALEYVQNKYEINEVFDDSEILDYIKSTFTADQIYDIEEINSALEEHDYTAITIDDYFKYIETVPKK